MALPPGVEPLHVEDDQGAQDEHPDGAQAWHRPVLYVVAGVIGLLVFTIGIYQWGNTNGINATGGTNQQKYLAWIKQAKTISKDEYELWQKYAISRMVRKQASNTGPFWPVGRNGIWVTKKKVLLAIVPNTYDAESFWNTAPDVSHTLKIKALSVAGAIDKIIQYGVPQDDTTTFKHIGIAMEGASNVNQKKSKKTSLKGVDMLEIKFEIGDTDRIKTAWLDHAKKHIQTWTDAHVTQKAPVSEEAVKQILGNLAEVLTSVQKAIGKANGNHHEFNDLRVLLFQQPGEEQMVFTSAEVFQETGQYYIRNNRDEPNQWADPPKHGDWFCAIPIKNGETPRFMVTSYGQNNLLYDNEPGKTNVAPRMLREDVGHVVLTNLTLP